MPKPVSIQDRITAPAPAVAAMFWGRLKIPPPIMELTTIPARAMVPKFFEDLVLEVMKVSLIYLSWFSIFEI